MQRSSPRPTPHIRQACRSHSRTLRLEAQHSAHHCSQKLATQHTHTTGNIPVPHWFYHCIDYSAFFHSCISSTNMAKLQVIQNKSIRILFHLPYDTNTLTYNFTHCTSTIKSRLLYLTNKYLCYALQQKTRHQSQTSSLNSLTHITALYVTTTTQH